MTRPMMVTVEFRHTSAPRIIPPHVSLWYTGIDEELNPFPYAYELESHDIGSITKARSYDPGDNAPNIELCECRRAGEDGLREYGMRHISGVGMQDRRTVPTSMVAAPAMIIRFRPISSPQKKVIRLPTAHPMSYSSRYQHASEETR